MAKVVFKNLPQLKKSIRDTFEQVKSDPKMLLEIGEKTVELTLAFNRSGKSPAGNKKHPANSEAWENRKARLATVNNPSEFYRPGLSNVTFTGQLLESIKVLKIIRSKGSVEIDATGDHQPYKNLSGERSGKKIKNSKLVEYLKEKGRIIFGLNRQIENNVNRIVRRYINQAIKKFNKQ